MTSGPRVTVHETASGRHGPGFQSLGTVEQVTRQWQADTSLPVCLSSRHVTTRRTRVALPLTQLSLLHTGAWCLPLQ